MQKREVVDIMNRFQAGLGDAFATDKIDFECEATAINDHEAWAIMMRDDIGFDYYKANL